MSQGTDLLGVELAAQEAELAAQSTRLAAAETILEDLRLRVEALEEPATEPDPPPTDPEPDPDPPPPDPVPATGIFLNEAEILALPTSGAAWDNLIARTPYSAPNLSVQDPVPGAAVVANAIAFVRTGEAGYRDTALRLIADAQGTEGGRSLEMGRSLPPYIIAADLLGVDISAWLAGVVATVWADGRTLADTHETRPNNWGTSCGSARAAAALYLGDTAELERAALIFRAYLGDRSAYADFNFGDLSWQADPANPVGVNPLGATIDGHDVDGVLPDDQRRTSSFTWPAPKGNYPWGAMQGIVAQARMLSRAGYDVYNWQDQAIRRAAHWLIVVNENPASDDDLGVTWFVNAAYGTTYATGPVGVPGKSGLLWGDWLFGA